MSDDSCSGDWIAEKHKGILEMRFRVRERLYSERSEFQSVEVVDTAGYGKMLFNDGVVMISERDERIYHEMIAHVPLFVHPAPSSVLVIGGGDGGTVREVLRHPSVKRCRLVEIDAKVIDGCRKHIPQTAAALDDPRVEVLAADGVAWVAETDERYDVVLVDSSDPIGPAVPLFGPQFYVNVHRVLTDDGIVVSQAESAFYEMETQRSLLRILRERFERVQLYNYTNLTYPGALWSFTFASKSGLCPVGDFDPGRVAGSGLRFFYYNPGIHRAAFALPEFQDRELEALLSAPKDL